MKKTMKLLILSAIVVLSLNSCGGEAVGDDTATDDTVVTTAETTQETTAADTAEESTAADTAPVTAAETAEPVKEPEIINPLTGLACEVDRSDRRPAAIMINNIKVATPQEGISYADVMYECVVEGWQTRLMMLSVDYEELPVIGSVRSSREYYLDFAADFDAVYIHAGGSEKAYTEMKQRKIDHLDGVNMYIPNMFYRDPVRQQNMGFEHSLMTDGERIEKGIEYVGCRTERDPDFAQPLCFVPYGESRVPDGESCEYLKVKYSGVHQPCFEYDSDEQVYYRWQFLGDKHMDNTADVQLSFTNIIVLYMPSVNTGDSYNHMDIDTTGSGEGYYISMGGREDISWEKSGKDSPMKLFDKNGEPLLVNRGKTFFQICTDSMKNTTELK